MGFRYILVVVALNAVPSLLWTQERIEVGTRVRVTVDQEADGVGSPVTGNVLELRTDSLWLRPEDSNARLALPLGSVRLLEVSTGQRSQARRGAGIGALLGGASLATWGYLDVRACEPDPVPHFFGGCTPESTAIVLGLVIGGALGGGLGYMIGSTDSTERWRVLPLAHRGGASLQITLLR